MQTVIREEYRKFNEITQNFHYHVKEWTIINGAGIRLKGYVHEEYVAIGCDDAHTVYKDSWPSFFKKTSPPFIPFEIQDEAVRRFTREGYDVKWA